MAAVSGNLGASWSFNQQFVPYLNVSTSFETPTTTELVNQPGRYRRVQPGPGPAARSELRDRRPGTAAARVTYSVALFLGRISDAIVQAPEVGGRAFFRNAGKTHNDGAEVGLTVTPVEWLTLSGAYTYARYRFVEDARGPARRQPSPRRARALLALAAATVARLRLLLRCRPHLSTSMAADDVNTPDVIADSGERGDQPAAGLAGRRGRDGAGALPRREQPVGPAVRGSVTLNGAGGRVFEPAPRRVVYRDGGRVPESVTRKGGVTWLLQPITIESTAKTPDPDR